MTLRRPTFFMKRSDRLIARLWHLIAGMRFAKQVDGQMIMAWTPLPEWFHQFDGGREYHIDYILDLRRYYAEGGYRNLFFFNSVALFPRDLPHLDGAAFEAQRPDKFDRQYFLEQAPTVYSGHYYGYQFADENKTKEELDGELRQVYASIPHNPVTANIIATAKQKIGAEGYVALHIRQGDVGEMLRRDLPTLANGKLEAKALALTIGHYLGRTAPYDSYFPEVEAAIAAGEKILFTSDTPATIAHFTKKFGPKNFIDINKFANARIPIQKAFVDFNLLIGSKRIISSGSTYAGFAGILGNAPVTNVTLRGTVDRLEQFAVEEYGPTLAGNTAMRDALTAEIQRQYDAHPRVRRAGA